LMSQYHAAPKALTSKKPHNTELREPIPAFSNVMDTKDIQTSACFKLAFGAQRPPTPGAVAHMSLHLINNVKEPDRLAAAPLPSPVLSRAVLPLPIRCEPAGEAPI